MNCKKVLWILMILGVIFIHNIPCFAGTWWDDFDDGNYREWKIYNLDRTAEKWTVKKGEAVGEIFQPGFMSLLLTGEPKWNNYTVECRAKFVKESKDNVAELGLSLYDGGDENERYLFSLYLMWDTVSIKKEHKGKWTTILFHFDSEMDTWYTLKASVTGGNLEFYVNEQLFTAEDADEPLESGKIGLVVANAVAHFDDVAISGPGIPSGGQGKPRSVQSRGNLAAVWGRLKRITNYELRITN